MRLRLVRDRHKFRFLHPLEALVGHLRVMVVVAAISFLVQGLNFGIDFRGGTTIRTESPRPVIVSEYRDAMTTLGLGDITITEVFDPTFGAEQNVAMIRIQAQDDQEAVTTEVIEAVEAALQSPCAPTSSSSRWNRSGPKSRAS